MLPISPEIIQACRRGDTEAFEALVRATERPVFSLVYRIVGNREDAADVAQEVYLRVWRSIGGLRGDAAFPGWLARVASNAAVTFLRRRGRLTEPLTEDAPGSEPDPGELQARVTADDVEQALGRLPSAYRVVLVLKEMQGLSIQEIAHQMGTTPGAVKVRLFRARNRLAAELATGGVVIPLRKATS